MVTELILIKPEDVQKGGAYRFSDQIINSLRKADELFVIGMGNAISLTCTAVLRATSIANVKISEVGVNYVGIPKLGITGVFFILDKQSKINWDEKKKRLEKGMNLSFERGGQLLIVSNNLPIDRAIPLALSRLADSSCIKISAAGTAINRAVSIALELTQSDISPCELGTELVIVFTVQYTKGETTVPETVMDIFVSKGKKPSSKKHEQMLKMLTSG